MTTAAFRQLRTASQTGQPKSLGLVALFLLAPNLAAAELFSGKVVGVADGDTITVLHGRRPAKIRLHGVDCPEKKQPFGQKAVLPA